MPAARQWIADLLRKMRLLTLADRVMLLGEILRTRSSNRRFLAEHPDFPEPPAALAYDAYNHVNWRQYHDSGLLHARFIGQLIRQYCPLTPNSSPARGRGEFADQTLKICEWGCGPGRVIRHLRGALDNRKIELFGADYNSASIAWCREHLHGIDFRVNGLEPPLPYEASTFDVLYALSVFTHLSAEGHQRWIDEVFRVVRPAGLVIFTAHGDACTDRLLPHEQQQYRAGNLVVRGGVYEGSKCFVAYHPPAYVREHLLRNANVAAHLLSPMAYQMIQDVWVARKKE